jgi:hypothetical protein
MGLREIRHQVAKLCQRFVGRVERVPEWDQIREFDSHDMACDGEKSEASERPFRAPAEVHGQGAPSLAPRQQRADIATNKCLSASEVARGVLGPDSTAAITNVLVFGTGGSTPLKRTEIHLGDPKEVPATFNLLAVALRRSGVDLRVVRNPSIPATEIWLTSPLDDGKKTLLSCAAIGGVQVNQRVVAQVGPPRSQTQ